MDLATVRLRRVHIRGTDNPKKYGLRFSGDGWDHVVENQQLEARKPFSLININGNSLSLITFARNGLGLGFETIKRPPVNEDFPICRSPMDEGMELYYLKILYNVHCIIVICLFGTFKTDKRMFHICEWEGHDEHRDKGEYFYTPMLAHVF